LVPLTQTSQEAEHWQVLEMHNLLLDQETFGTHKREFYYQAADKPKVRVQPFGAFTYKNFDALDKSSTQFDLELTFFLDGQHKITAQYSARPVYTTPSNTSGSKGEFIVQLQIYL
jgi:hypothetical protein